MHPFSLLEINSREKNISFIKRLISSQIKKEKRVSTIPTDGILWIQLLLGIYSCTAKFMSLSASGMWCWGSQDLWLQAAGTQGLPPRHKSWKSSQAFPFPPAIIPLYQTKPWPIQGPEQRYVWVFASWTLIWTTKYCLPWVQVLIFLLPLIFLSCLCSYAPLLHCAFTYAEAISPKLLF